MGLRSAERLRSRSGRGTGARCVCLNGAETVSKTEIVGLVVWVSARLPRLRDLSAREQLDARLASGAIGIDENRKRLDALGG
jgi:hypothetical protein